MRTFIAIPLPEEIKKALAHVQSKLKTFDIRVTWVNPKIFHLTLEFLGDIAEGKIDEVRLAIEKACQQVNPFELEFGQLTLIPSLRQPRVVAVTIKGDLDSFWQLKNEIRNNLSPLGFRFEDEKSPHLTLGRLKGKLPLQTKKKLTQIPTQPLGFRIEKVTFMQSALTNSGPIYTPIAETPLTGD